MALKWLIPIALFGLFMVASSVSAQPPTLDQIESLQLRDGFTLTYTVVEKDVRTPEMKSIDAQAMVTGYQIMVKQGQIKQADADRMITMIRTQNSVPTPPQEFFVTMSVRNGKLLLVRDQREPQGAALGNNHPKATTDEKTIFLYDGQKTYWYTGNENILHIQKGFRTENISDCLIPGVGLPYLPLGKKTSPKDARKVSLTPADLIQRPDDAGRRCALLSLNTANPDAKIDNLYLPGEAYAQNTKPGIRLEKMLVGDAKRPLFEWDYQQPQLFQGLWLARRARYTENRIYVNGKPVSPVSSHVVDYRITLAQAVSLAAAKFDVRTYLPPDAQVEECSGMYTGEKPFRFVYNPSGGDLEVQRQAAIRHQAASQQQSDQILAQMDADQTIRGDGRDANVILSDAEAQAKSQGKSVFLVFHASWCEPCYLLHRFLNDPQVKPLLDAHYVIQELDIFERGAAKKDENPGGQAIFMQYGGQDSIPFYAVVDSFGAIQGNSIYNGKVTGMPSSPAIIDAFIGLIKKTAPGISGADLTTIQSVLKRDTVAQE